MWGVVFLPKIQATEEHQNENQRVDQAGKIETAQAGVDWQHKSGLFTAWWAHDTSDYQRRDAPGEVVIEGWTWPTTVVHGLSMNVKIVLLSSKPGI